MSLLERSKLYLTRVVQRRNSPRHSGRRRRIHHGGHCGSGVAHGARLIAELIGDAFIEAMGRSRGDSWGRARTAWWWILERTEAPPGIQLNTPDGATYTGLLFVERSQAVLLLAFRHPPRPSEPGEGRGASNTNSASRLDEWDSQSEGFDLFDPR